MDLAESDNEAKRQKRPGLWLASGGGHCFVAHSSRVGDDTFVVRASHCPPPLAPIPEITFVNHSGKEKLMIQMSRTLETISTDYSIFEKDQVLTHDQLNSIADYCTDEIRLTRVKLLGVGIVCGLRASLSSDLITVTRGSGVSTDGDLMFFEEDAVFDQYKPYDESAPVYEPFYVAGKIIPAFDLVRQNVKDERAASLKDFVSDTGINFSNVVVVLLMESYIQDDDLCSGTDCDNLGKKAVNRLKVILIEKSSVGQFLVKIKSPDEAAANLPELFVERVLLSPSISSKQQFAQAYRLACTLAGGRLKAAIPGFYTQCSFFLSDSFSGDPTGLWIGKLDGLQAKYMADDFGIQYFYDFLKDVVETWNSFRAVLTGEKTWCCPDLEAFPKHLLLGNLIPTANPNENRFGLYPSPLVSQARQGLGHARFLAKKLDAMISAYIPPIMSPVKITPSRFEEDALEIRAIPFYYHVDLANPIHKAWNYQLTRRGMETYNYSYNGPIYGAQGAAANPLTAQIGAFSFFRIEGCIGREVAATRIQIENEAAAKNLPITVLPVLMGQDPSHVVKKPGVRYGDLHRIHYLMRQDMGMRLDEALSFNDTFKTQIDYAVDHNLFPDTPKGGAGGSVKGRAATKHNSIKEAAGSARGAMSKKYSDYRSSPKWKSDVNTAQHASGEFKYEMGEALRTEFSTPFDSLVATNQQYWLDWLDEIIDQKDLAADSRQLFAKFIVEHPGAEHFAGVLRGGTFVLIHDTNGLVIGDLMLPYHCCETAEEEPEEPGLKKPDAFKPIPYDTSFTLKTPIDIWILDQIKNPLDDYKAQFEKDWTTRFDMETNYVRGFKESIEMIGNIWANPGNPAEGFAAGYYNDKILENQVNESKYARQKVDLFREKAKQPNTPKETQKYYEKMAKDAEVELAKNIKETADYISRSGIKVNAGTEGYKAMLVLAENAGAVTSVKTRSSLSAGLQELSGKTADMNFKTMVGGMAGH
jgi:hypothetical protein